MAPILYHQITSPPSRAVRMVALALNIPLELKSLNLFAGEHLTPEFLKINPQHTVPCLDDDGFILWDSHVIITYLINKYVKNDTTLYPKDLKMRSRIDQRNLFDTGILFAKLRELLVPVVFKGGKLLSITTMEDIVEGYEFVESFLENNDYLCGNNITIADISCASTIEDLLLVVPMSKKLKKTAAWLQRVKSYPPYAEINPEGKKAYEDILKDFFPLHETD